MSKYNKVVVGIDQSYANTGISIAADDNLLLVRSIDLSKCSCNSVRRRVLAQNVSKAIRSATACSDDVICIVERIRLHSGANGFINIDYIKAVGALIAAIVDTCTDYDVPVYSVDTRCWKSQVVGTTKPCTNKYGVPPEKWPTVQWCIDKGFKKQLLVPIEGRKEKGTFLHNGVKYMYNNDAADSAAIAMFGFIGDSSKLKREK